jgi:hypothetical protein
MPYIRYIRTWYMARYALYGIYCTHMYIYIYIALGLAGMRIDVHPLYILYNVGCSVEKEYKEL